MTKARNRAAFRLLLSTTKAMENVKETTGIELRSPQLNGAPKPSTPKLAGPPKLMSPQRDGAPELGTQIIDVSPKLMSPQRDGAPELGTPQLSYIAPATTTTAP